jgi:primosomal protein N' (replication factor Y)
MWTVSSTSSLRRARDSVFLRTGELSASIGRERERVAAKAREFGTLLAARRASKTDILGPAECPLSLIAGNYREQLILRTGDFSSCHLAVEQVYRSFDKGRNVYIEIDVDPVSIL